MLNQSQSDALLAFLDAKIEDIKSEMETSEAVHAEAPNRNEWTDFCHADFMSELHTKRRKYQRLYAEAEMLEIVDDVPAASPSRAAIFAVNAVGVIGGMFIGMLLSVAIIYRDSDILWNNSESFWRQLI